MNDGTTASDPVQSALRALRRGQAVVYPTETFYALGVDALNFDAMLHLCEIKGREPGKPIGLIAADLAMVRAIVREMPAAAQSLAERFWPGPLTIVLPARPGLPEELMNEEGGVGIRVSAHPLARELARALGSPLTATSANRAGEPAATTIAQARASFGDRVAVYLDGGTLGAQPPSTVIDFHDGEMRVLRAGAIGPSELAAALRPQPSSHDR